MLAVLAAFFCLLFFAAAKKSRCRPAQGQRVKREGITRMPAKTPANPTAVADKKTLSPLLNHSISRMIMNRLEVLRFEHISNDPLISIQPLRDIAHQVFNELRVLVSTLGNELLIRPLEQPPQLTRSLFFRDTDQILDGHVIDQLSVNRHMRALIM